MHINYHLQVVPRVFIQKYAESLKDTIKIWMADRNVWIVCYSKVDSTIFGSERLLNNYLILCGYLVVLHYFGKSTFYMSIFGFNGVDILNSYSDKMLLENVVVVEKSSKSFSYCDTMDDYEGTCLTLIISNLNFLLNVLNFDHMD